MNRGWDVLEGPVGSLAVHVAPDRFPSAGGVVVMCHGFPAAPDSAPRTADSLMALADRLAAESGWSVLAGCLRGVGPSPGDFCLGGWLEDLRVLTDHAARGAGHGVRIVGFGTGGALGLCLAADDARVRGVACLGSPATFEDWAQDVPAMLELARRAGLVCTPGYPPDLRAWGEGFARCQPEKAARRISPRRVLIVHGADDDEVPVSDARMLADAVGSSADLRVLSGAGHRLGGDPRAFALLVGWLERQGP